MDDRSLPLPSNTLDVTILDPGDILLVANPSDMAAIRYLSYWSHVGLVSIQGNVIDAVREPRGEYDDTATWYQVQRVPMSSYQKNYDLLALRPRLPLAARQAAARYAESKLGLPYAPSMWRIFFGRNLTSCYSCASLVWQAYKEQGLDLAPAPALPNLNVLPLFLARDAQLQVLARGTCYAALPVSALRWRLERWWFSRVLGACVGEDSLPAPVAGARRKP